MWINQGNQAVLSMAGGQWSCRCPSLDYLLGDLK